MVRYDVLRAFVATSWEAVKILYPIEDVIELYHDVAIQHIEMTDGVICIFIHRTHKKSLKQRLRKRLRLIKNRILRRPSNEVVSLSNVKPMK